MIDIEEAARLYREGLHCREVAERFGVHQVNIWKQLKAHGVRMRARGGSRPVAHLDAVLALRRDGLSFAAIGAKLGFSRQRAHQIYQKGIDHAQEQSAAPVQQPDQGGRRLDG